MHSNEIPTTSMRMFIQSPFSQARMYPLTAIKIPINIGTPSAKEKIKVVRSSTNAPQLVGGIKIANVFV